MTYLKKIWSNKTRRFLITFLSIFALIYYFNQFFIGITIRGGYYNSFIDQHLDYVSGLRYILIHTSSWILNQFGYSTFNTEYWLRVSGEGGIVLVYSCLGFGIMSFFTAFVTAWPKPLKSKLWFLPAGLVFIQALNILRFILLCLYWRGSIFKGMINHHDLFNIILYAFLLGIIYFWVNAGQEKQLGELK